MRKSNAVRNVMGDLKQLRERLNPRRQKDAAKNVSQSQPPRHNLNDEQGDARDPSELTLGVEFEFLIVKYFDQPAPPPDLELGMKLVHGLLQDPVTALCSGCGQQHQFHLPLNPMMSGLLEENVARKSKATSNFNKWTVMAESTLELDLKDKMKLRQTASNAQVSAVELVTRKLRSEHGLRTAEGCAVDPMGWHSVSYQEEIQAVLHAMQDAFNTPGGANVERRDTRLVVNHTGGLHVHVGNERKGFPLQVTKNIMKMCTAFERTIDSMTAVTRIGGTELTQVYLDDSSCDSAELSRQYPILGLHDGVYNQPMSSYFLSSARRIRARRNYYHNLIPDRARYPESHLNATQLDTIGSSFESADWIELIQLAPSILALQTMMVPDSHKAALNPENLDAYEHPRNDIVKMTMEFRQQKAVITAEETLPWIDFVLNIVGFAHGSDTAAFDNWCLNECRSPKPDLDCFFTTLGVSANTKDYWLKRTSLETNAMESLAEAEDNRTDAFGLGHPLTHFVKFLTRNRCDAHNAANIEKAIEAKLAGGGYGRFPRPYLDALQFLDESRKPRLVPTWEPTAEEEEEESSLGDDHWRNSDDDGSAMTSVSNSGTVQALREDRGPSTSNTSRWADPDRSAAPAFSSTNVSKWAVQSDDASVADDQGQDVEMETLPNVVADTAQESYARSKRSSRESTRSRRSARISPYKL